MAQPFDNALTLQVVSNLIQTQYFDTALEQTWMTGSMTNRLVNYAKQAVVGDGLVFQIINGHAFNGRLDTDALSDFVAPSAFLDAQIKARFNERTPGSNDFVKFATAARVSIYDIQRVSSKGAVTDLAQKVIDDIRFDFDYLTAIHRNLDRTAQIATVNATPVNNDSNVFASGTTYTSNATSCRFQIANGSIAAFQPNMDLDFYSSAGAQHAVHMKVTDVNTADLSIGVTTNTFYPTATANCNNIASADSIYLSGERNKGMYSFGSWFSVPTSSDSFMGGVNRSTSTNRYLLPTWIRQGATSRAISKYDFDDAARALGLRDDSDGPRAVAAHADPAIHDRLRQDITDDALITWPSDNGGYGRYANFGSESLSYQHPVLGRVVLVADPLALPNRVRFVRPEYMLSLAYGTTALQFMQDGENGGVWKRLPSSTPNNGGSLFYQAEAFCNIADYCKYPSKALCEIQNVTS